jgi:hypothetical protein
MNTEHRNRSGSKKGLSRLSNIPLSEKSSFFYKVPNSSFLIKAFREK